MEYDDFTVVLPTLNEEKNIANIISRLKSAYKGIWIIVADDGSMDGTRSESLRMKKGYGRVAFIDRKAMGKQKGLTASVVDGIMSSRTRFVIVMDADMQHPYGLVKKMAARLRSGDTLAVGVRAEVRDWPLYRKLISKGLIFIGYAVLFLEGRQSCGDIFSGFFGMERRFFVSKYKKNRGRFVGSGFKVLFDLLKCMDKGEAKVSDLPYTFESRRFGKSKAGAKQAFALLRSFIR